MIIIPKHIRPYIIFVAIWAATVLALVALFTIIVLAFGFVLWTMPPFAFPGWGFFRLVLILSTVNTLLNVCANEHGYNVVYEYMFGELPE